MNNALWKRVEEVPNATFTSDWEWLSEVTKDSCSFCKASPLLRWESLNGVCEACYEKYIAECEDFKEGDPLAEMGVPKRYRHYGWDTYEKSWGKALPGRVMEWGKDPKGILVLLGPAGTGKTWAATAAVRLARDHGRHPYWRDAGELLSIARTQHRTGESPELNKAWNCDVLLLDDLGAERKTEYAEDVFEMLLRHRHAAVKPTIITTNVPFKDWGDTNASLARRIFERPPVEFRL